MNTTTDHPVITAARERITKAERDATALRDRIANGNTNVSPLDLAQADAAVELARLQLESAERIVAAEATNRDRAEALAAEIRAEVDAPGAGPLGELDELRQAAEDAIERLCAAAERHRSTTVDFIKRVEDIPDHQAHGLHLSRFAVGGVPLVRTPEALIVGPSVESVLAAAVEPVLERHEVRRDWLGNVGQWSAAIREIESGPASATGEAG